MRSPTFEKWLVAAFAAMALIGFWRVFSTAAESGDAFPELSSMRADKKGSLAYYLSLADLPGLDVRRNFEPIQTWKPSGTTILILGESSAAWHEPPQTEFDEAERLAKLGNRVVIGLRYEERAPRFVEHTMRIQDRWGVSIRENKRVVWFDIKDPKWTAAIGKTAVERGFGTGSIALIANCEEFMNASLRDHRDTPLLAWAARSSSGRVVFDEAHLGTVASGSLMGLIRRFRLEWALLVFILAGALYAWRGSSALLPPQPAEPPPPGHLGARAGLAGLLRRNVAPSNLAAFLGQLFEQGLRYQPGIGPTRAQSVRTALPATAPADWPALWGRIHNIIRERK